MHKIIGKLNDAAKCLMHQRFACPAILLPATAVLLVSEITYRDTTRRLGGGIQLTDARIQSQRLLQPVTEAETAQFAFLIASENEYLRQL